MPMLFALYSHYLFILSCSIEFLKTNRNICITHISIFFFSSKILKRHFTNIVQIIINHIPLWNSWREDYSDLNGFWIIKLNLVCFESYSSVDTTVNGRGRVRRQIENESNSTINNSDGITRLVIEKMVKRFLFSNNKLTFWLWLFEKDRLITFFYF